MMISNSSPMYAAFAMEGLRDFCKDSLGYAKLLERWNQGCYELVDEMNRHVGYFDEAIAPWVDDDCGFPGVFEYEVCNPFGMWFAEYILKHGYAPIESEVKAEIDRLVDEFFTQ